MDQVISQLVRPRLRTLPAELLKDVTYLLDEDAFSSADYQDIVRKRFIKSWEALVDGFVVSVLNASLHVCSRFVRPIVCVHGHKLSSLRRDCCRCARTTTGKSDTQHALLRGMLRELHLFSWKLS